MEKALEGYRRYLVYLISKYGRPKIGRWIYCKYCYKNIQPFVDFDLIKCSECQAGLAPLDNVIICGSLKRFMEYRSEDSDKWLEESGKLIKGELNERNTIGENKTQFSSA